MLTAIGLGPGDPELLTLRAVRALKEADTVFVPGGIAFELVKPYAKNIVTLDFPMTRDESVISECMRQNAEKILPAAKSGSAVFGLIGDPNFYSTFSRLANAVREHYPELEVETIPGISSITAFASHAKIAVNGAFTVTDGPADPSVKIMMKVTKPKVREAELRKEGFNDFVLVERMYMDGETVYKGEMPEKTNYFSIMAARKL
ncbi:MAG: cobalt-factor II C(20)-methyltransferase [Methanomicrobium sp.]|jgi:precorrin-2/cobalt-factor-2 C20-methyltransferase|uniref:cobalt-factor II C(20)-methyltransferase n=1 Tax=Methanomicrobium mobile TaxID=2205 RepID=UPI0005B2C3FA|nr:cobalt-factor II C(20)-methyltransferase [Methanomicrobium mobile]MBP5083766.1 cobalt-factor II C(20)-methyltransferase [Methanomicrobium sp.]